MKTKAGAGLGGAAPSPHWTEAAVRPPVLRGPPGAGTRPPEGGDALQWCWTKLETESTAAKWRGCCSHRKSRGDGSPVPLGPPWTVSEGAAGRTELGSPEIQAQLRRGGWGRGTGLEHQGRVIHDTVSVGKGLDTDGLQCSWAGGKGWLRSLFVCSQYVHSLLLIF